MIIGMADGLVDKPDELSLYWQFLLLYVRNLNKSNIDLTYQELYKKLKSNCQKSLLWIAIKGLKKSTFE